MKKLSNTEAELKKKVAYKKKACNLKRKKSFMMSGNQPYIKKQSKLSISPSNLLSYFRQA